MKSFVWRPFFLGPTMASLVFLAVGCGGEEPVIENGPAVGELTCEDLFVDDPTQLPVYPSVYQRPTNSESVFQERWTAFLDSYGVDDGSYVAEPHGVYWTPDIERAAEDWIVMPTDVEMSDHNAETVARDFIERWASLLGAENSLLNARYVNCSGAICALDFDQDYCGLDIASEGLWYEGRIQVSFEPEDWGLRHVMSSLLPLLPIPSSPSVTSRESIDALIGTRLEYNCSNGTHHAEITSASTFAPREEPVVFVRKAPLLDRGALEFRLAWEVAVTPDENGSGSWTAHIDAIDGTVLQIVEHFDC